MNGDFPFDTRGLSEAERQSFLTTYNELKARFQAEVDNEFKFNLNKLSLFSGYIGVNIRVAIDVSRGKRISHITFAKVDYIYAAGKTSQREGIEYQTWGVATLQKDYGHVLIKPETLMDKIQEVIQPMELDFVDDPEFSKKFYVLTEDKEKVKATLNSNLRNAISDIGRKDFLIEIFNNQIVIGNRKLVEPESAVCFAEFLNHVSSLR